MRTYKKNTNSNNKTEYTDMVFVIFNFKGISEKNYLYSYEDFARERPDLAQCVKEYSSSWVEDYITANKSLMVKRCKNMREFNDFIRRRFNTEGGDMYVTNRFSSNDNGALLCETLGGETREYNLF